MSIPLVKKFLMVKNYGIKKIYNVATLTARSSIHCQIKHNAILPDIADKNL
jgi:hypothetical protein